MKIGDSASTTRVFDTEAIAGYEALSAAPNATGGVPEPLIGGLFSYLLGAELPGYGTNYLKQALDFVGTAEVGTPLTASVTITRILGELRNEGALSGTRGVYVADPEGLERATDHYVMQVL